MKLLVKIVLRSTIAALGPAAAFSLGVWFFPSASGLLPVLFWLVLFVLALVCLRIVVLLENGLIELARKWRATIIVWQRSRRLQRQWVGVAVFKEHPQFSYLGAANSVSDKPYIDKAVSKGASDFVLHGRQIHLPQGAMKVANDIGSHYYGAWYQHEANRPEPDLGEEYHREIVLTAGS